MGSRLISSDSTLKDIWDILIAFITIFIAIDIPIKLAFDYHLLNIYIELTITILFFIDIIINFNTQFYSKGILIKSRKEIASTYLKKYFIFDLIAAIPFLFLTIYFPAIKWLKWLSLARFFKFMRIRTIIRKWRNRHTVNPSIIRLGAFFFWILIITHLIACIWVYVARIEQLETIPTYIDSLYWCVTTLTTVGYGDISPVTDLQKIWTMIVEILGVVVYGYVIGNVASLLSNIDVAKAGFIKQMEDINRYLSYKSIPKKLKQKVNNYYQYIWDNRLGHGDSGILSNLPPSLRTEILLHINRQLIEQVPFFKDTDKEFINDIIAHLQPKVFLPDDFIFMKGDIGRCMYFISSGTVDVLSEDKKSVIAELRDGDYFGEIALIKKITRTRSVIARDYCKLYSLEKKNFDALLKKYPKFKEHIYETIKKRQSTDE
jgi:voltage-gated potassium channel